jgi:dihydroorotase
MSSNQPDHAQAHFIRLTDVRVIDPYRGMDYVGDVVIGDGRFHDPERNVSTDMDRVSARGLWLVPRLTDMHVHFRAPGQEWKEDIESGARAAAHGGVTAVAAMPNTEPIVDSASLVAWQRQEAARLGLVDLYPIGAISKGSQGEELAELWTMEQAGAVGFSDDGRPLASSRLMRAALSYSTTLKHPIIQHAEDRDLSRAGVMHEGDVSGRLGLVGVPAEAESSMVWRDVQLAALTGGRLHVAHVSSIGSLEAIEWAKRHGLKVSAEVTPHHLFFTDERVANPAYDSATKVNPPLRPETIRVALLQALKSGLIEVVASDHAPHHGDEKAHPYAEAPFGISGLETLIGATMMVALGEGAMSPLDLFERMTRAPHRVLNLTYGGVSPGEWADFALIDPKRRWRVGDTGWYSKGKNSPWMGRELIGQVISTMHRGDWTMQEGEVGLCRPH